jgi:hypothetical protein
VIEKLGIMAGDIAGLALASPATVAFAVRIEQTQLRGRALGVPVEKIRADIAEALQRHARSEADDLDRHLRDVERRWSL